jgi:hypothetical protein
MGKLKPEDELTVGLHFCLVDGVGGVGLAEF